MTWFFDCVHRRVFVYAAQFLTENRGLFVCVFLLPLSIVCNVLWYIRMYWMTSAVTTAKLHKARVMQVALAVSQSTNDKKLCTDRPGYATMSLKGDAHKLNAVRIPMKSLLVDIVELDEKNLTVTVEPLVNMGQLSRYLIARGFTLTVLPELDELTVGGLLMGFGIESSSHIYGLFQETCVEYEVVLGDGQVVKAASHNEYSDLFRALPWSYGTLGLLVSAKLKIIRCEPYVRLSYRKFEGNLSTFVSAFTKASCARDPSEALFVESLVFSSDHAVLMTATFTSSASDSDATFNDIGRWYKEGFYLHVQNVTKHLLVDGSNSVNEIIPLRSYYHRHTRSIFWEMQHIVPFCNEAWFRYLLGWAVPPNIPLLKATQTKAMKKMWLEQFCVQDMLVPISKLLRTIQYMDTTLGIYPMWLCPHTVHRTGGMLKPTLECTTSWEMFVDVGLYGVPTKNVPYRHLEVMPRIEAFVRSVGGFQGLYAVCYMTRDEFYQMFDHDLYQKCRKKYNAEKRFPEVYDKVAGVPSF